MKTVLLLLMIFMFTPGQAPIDRLIGRWKLEKVETKTKTYLPTKRVRKGIYYLAIDQTKFVYNLDANDCWTDIVSVNDTSITLNFKLITDVCCDGKDSIAKYIDYSGNYTLYDSLLIITNEEGKHYLIKQ